MAQSLHSQAPHHLPGFLPGADGSDFLFSFTVVMMIVIALGIGVAYFTIHALPEKMAHKANSTQLQLIGVLCLLALFTHNNLFWVVALLLAAVRVPDFISPLKSISQSLEELKDWAMPQPEQMLQLKPQTEPQVEPKPQLDRPLQAGDETKAEKS